MTDIRELTVDELQYELQKSRLKNQALLEDVAKTRDENANQRVEITMLSQQMEQLVNQLRQTNEQGAEVAQEEAPDEDSDK